ncbi:MAG: hypothetical protein ONB23_05400 [candidate division KSB1 bacterium]|nr:hypothetical protein [candidate division KSB1 bacterium]
MRKVWRVIRWVLGVAVLLIALLASWIAWRVRDRQRDYELNLFLPRDPAQPPGTFSVGFGRASVTPQGWDWVLDRDGNARYEPAKGDTFVDVNGNGRFDPIYLAGFHNNRPAAGVHDEIEARAVVLDDGRLRIGLVAVDAIGLMHNDVVELRRSLPGRLAIDHLIVHATHNHEVPDLIGIWGRTPFRCGVDPAYRRYVRQQILGALEAAVTGLRPALLSLAQVEAPPELVADSRRPYVVDRTLRLLIARDALDHHTLGTLVFWANHPETLGSRNLLITADFVGYLRHFLEEGISWQGETVAPGLGGTAVFFNGAIGGLMTPLGTEIEHPFTRERLRENTFAKAEALGLRLALLGLEAARKAVPISQPSLFLGARTFRISLENRYFLLGTVVGVIQRGWSGWKRMRTEVDLLQIGEVDLLTVPGEIYPEIVIGGVEHPPGADFDTEPVEVPPLFELLPGRTHILVGLANDEIGYIIPRSEWDTKPPYLYGAPESPYGEVNSVGPEAGPAVYQAARQLIEDLQRWKSSRTQPGT